MPQSALSTMSPDHVFEVEEILEYINSIEANN